MLVNLALVMFLCNCQRSPYALTEDEVKKCLAVHPIFASVLESDRQFFMALVERYQTSGSAVDLQNAIYDAVKSRRDFNEINSRMKALGMSFDEFTKTWDKVRLVYVRIRMGCKNVDSLNWFLKYLKDNIPKAGLTKEQQEAVKKDISFYESMKNVPIRSMEIVEKYYDQITDAFERPSW